MAAARFQSTLRGRLTLVGINSRLKRGGLARRGASLLTGAGFYDIPCTLMMLTRLAVGLEPLNALDAAHRSPRSISGIGSPADSIQSNHLAKQRTGGNLKSVAGYVNSDKVRRDTTLST